MSDAVCGKVKYYSIHYQAKLVATRRTYVYVRLYATQPTSCKQSIPISTPHHRVLSHHQFEHYNNLNR